MRSRKPTAARVRPPSPAGEAGWVPAPAGEAGRGPAGCRRRRLVTGGRLGAVFAGLAVALLVLASCGGDDPPEQVRTVANDAKAKVDTAKASACATRVTVLFWPQGHPAIPAIDSPHCPWRTSSSTAAPIPGIH